MEKNGRNNLDQEGSEPARPQTDSTSSSSSDMRHIAEPKDATSQKKLSFVLVIFVVALLVRLVYLYESLSNPSFNVPVAVFTGHRSIQ